MKKMMTALLLTILSFNSQWLAAHGEGHGAVNASQAQAIALSITKKLSFKDLGFSVGKLDASWRKVSSENTSVLPSDSDKHIIQVNNPENDKRIIVSVTPTGGVLTVKPAQ